MVFFKIFGLFVKIRVLLFVCIFKLIGNIFLKFIVIGVFFFESDFWICLFFRYLSILIILGIIGIGVGCDLFYLLNIVLFFVWIFLIILSVLFV